MITLKFTILPKPIQYLSQILTDRDLDKFRVLVMLGLMPLVYDEFPPVLNNDVIFFQIRHIDVAHPIGEVGEYEYKSSLLHRFLPAPRMDDLREGFLGEVSFIGFLPQCGYTESSLPERIEFIRALLLLYRLVQNSPQDFHVVQSRIPLPPLPLHEEIVLFHVFDIDLLQ